MLHQGRNTLYIYARDGSGVAGLIFSIRLTVHPLLASAAFAPFGNGCAGSFGTPSLGTATGSMPWIGETLEVQLNGLPATVLNTPFGMLGFSRDFWAGSPLPMELAGLGMPGCVAFVEPHAAVPLANAGGTASWFLAVPDSPAFVGTHFYVQGAVVDFGINPANLILSNAGEALVGAR
jgi:hypothetical protein